VELSLLNNLGKSEAEESLRHCCGSDKWVELMVSARPFASFEDLASKAEHFAEKLERNDWLQAFSHHPKIGDAETLRKKFCTGPQWEAGEQAGVATATDRVLEELAQGNQDYEKKFGYIFIVCATGKSADEMLAILNSRLPNDPEYELKIAADEQKKITRLRLEKLCQ
jgi:2-oxo-4-hydroxy-4-carboxy-5-ureidoimidazoline decarboxylase